MLHKKGIKCLQYLYRSCKGEYPWVSGPHHPIKSLTWPCKYITCDVSHPQESAWRRLLAPRLAPLWLPFLLPPLRLHPTPFISFSIIYNPTQVCFLVIIVMFAIMCARSLWFAVFCWNNVRRIFWYLRIRLNHTSTYYTYVPVCKRFAKQNNKNDLLLTYYDISLQRQIYRFMGSLPANLRVDERSNQLEVNRISLRITNNIVL